MGKNRLEAFSDGVIAILITIMVLELRVPDGGDFNALRQVFPHLLTYVMSFVYLAIYWNNHHHMLHTVERVNGKMLWANIHLLFWLSLIPFTTAWMGENGAAPVPTAVYGGVLIFAAIAYTILQGTIIALQGHGSKLKAAVQGDSKGKISILAYAAAIPAAFVDRRISIALYVFVALMWLVPDRRIESKLGS
jgi:uncharacterized membrane protein